MATHDSGGETRSLIVVAGMTILSVALAATDAHAQAQTDTTVLQPLVIEGKKREETGVGPVNGYSATRSTTGIKSDTPIKDIPQTVNVVTSDQMNDQGAQSMGEALRYTPGVSVENFGALSQTDAYTRVRGFRTDLYLDGTRLPVRGDGAASYAMEPWGLERIEVLKGPASSLYGASGPGGMINMVSKRPRADLQNEVQLQTGSYNRLQGAFDLGGPVTSDESALYRITGLIRDSDTQVDFAEDNRRFIAPSFTWKPSEDTTLTLLSHYSDEKSNWPFFNLMPPNGTFLSNPNGQIPRSRNTGEPDYDRLDRYQFSLGYDVEHHFADTLTVRQNLRYGEVKSDVNAVANVFGFFFTGDNRTIARVPIAALDKAEALTIDNRLEGKFDTGALGHSAIVGVDFRDEDSSRDFRQGAISFLDIYNPVYGAPIATPTTIAALSKTDERQIGAYAQDQIRFGSWLASFSGRYDWVQSKVHNQLTNVHTKQNDAEATGRAGLSYIFDNGIAPYISVATSFQPVSGLDAAGNPFTPSTGIQYEAGIKYQPPGSQSLFTAAVFDLTQQNVLTSDAFGFQRQTGEINIRGIELEAKTKLTEEWSLLASYAYLDAEVTKSQRVAELGRRPAETPDHQASLWTQYGFASGLANGLTVGGGVRYVGESEDDSHALKLPSYTLFDARIAYALGTLMPTLDGATLSVNGTNLTDKYYATGCFGTFATACALGPGRMVTATLGYKW